MYRYTEYLSVTVCPGQVARSMQRYKDDPVHNTPNYIYGSDFTTSFFLFGSPQFQFYKQNVGKKKYDNVKPMTTRQPFPTCYTYKLELYLYMYIIYKGLSIHKNTLFVNN